ncbi:MAG: asparagine synthase (glutamine-hydrolyzing) [Myxococcales bacterium]|nr:asparagine synthase (glutamine-hydrolyzing) [Myxococcales bacterium]
MDLDALARMNESITHRGPDEAGSYHDPGRVGLAMRRLSIIDLAGGRQPIANEDGSVRIVFNGEIYNFRQLRRELVGLGHTFRTQTDTEAILHGYEAWGDAVVERLRGMFTFAIWDQRAGRLFAARDRVGIKQLFFSEADGQLVFGSEIKALLTHPAVGRALSLPALNQYLAYLYVPEPATLFEGIHELRAGHTLVVSDGKLETKPYWKLRYDVVADLSESDAVAGLRRELEEAVRIRLVADVPLGAFLSGGIDSATMVALMARHSDRVKTFSIGYSGGGDSFDERVYARELADRYATDHTEFEMSPDIRDLVPRLVRAFDHPCANSTAVPTWFLCEETRRHVTVALSGLGGDEVAGGYERYRGALLGERLAWLPEPLVRHLIRPLAAALPDPKSGRQWAQRLKRFTASLSLPFDARYFEFICHLNREAREALLTDRVRDAISPDEPREIYEGYVREVADADALHRALYADLKLYLPGDLLTLMDRVSMAHSLEVRVPFLDHEVLEYAATISPTLKVRGMRLKHVLKEVARELLPESFIDRRKMGFSAPLAVWFRGELRGWVEEVLAPAELAHAGVFRPEAVRALLDRHFDRTENLDNQIWALIAFTVWHREHF